MLSIKMFKRLTVLVMFIMLVGSVIACGKKDDKEEETEATTDTTPVITEETTPPTTTIPTYSGPLPSNTVQISWTESAFDNPTVMYAYVSSGQFLRVRSGPSTEYDIVATLTTNMEVIVVARTDSGWYKTVDGFYVSGDYLTSTPTA